MGTQSDLFERATECTSFSARAFEAEVDRDLLRNERAILLKEINEAMKLLAEMDKLLAEQKPESRLRAQPA